MAKKVSKKVKEYKGTLLIPDAEGMREILKELGIKSMKQYKEYIKDLPRVKAKKDMQVPLAVLDQKLTKKQTEMLCKIADKYPLKNGKKTRTVDEWGKIEEELEKYNQA